MAVTVRPFDAGLAKTRRSFLSRLKDLALQPRLDPAYWEEFEAVLIGTDMSVSLVDEIVRRLRDREERFQLNGPQQVEGALRAELLAVLSPGDRELKTHGTPGLVLLVGVNGSGKTTTAAKLAHQLSRRGRHPLLAAADTFRAAAIEQLETWAGRVGVPIPMDGNGAQTMRRRTSARPPRPRRSLCDLCVTAVSPAFHAATPARR